MIVFRFFFTTFIISTFLLNSINSRDNDENNCNSIRLSELGCKCSSESYANNFQCPNRLNQLNCVFNENVYVNKTHHINYYDNVIEDLSRLDELCWSQLYFENILKISSLSLSNIKFSAHRNRTGVYLWFKNVLEVDSFAFADIPISSDENFIIRLQSGITKILFIKA